MEIVYGKILTEEESAKVNNLAKQCDVEFDTARLLFTRGIDTVDKVKRFFNSGKKYFYNPFLLSGMQSAVERIKIARDKNEKVLVFGDYDADGICATTILKNCLETFGIKADYLIPERSEGYGLNYEKIKNSGLKPDLVITVDCGISDAEKIVVMKEDGIDVIVTDHHEIPPILPDCVCINPKLPSQAYPFNGLCGAGVAYKLGYALIGESADRELDLAALATVADSMELISENRDIVSEGLKIFNSDNLRLPFTLLLDGSGKTVTSQTLAFGIAPRINAGGRMGDALTSLIFLTSENRREISDAYEKLKEYNVLRQCACDGIYEDAKTQIYAQKLFKDSVIVVCGESWQHGTLGIVSARLTEEFSRPTIVFAGQGDGYKGSSRSVDGVNIFELLSSVKEYTTAFGGHAQAAGVSVEKDKLKDFVKAINESFKTLYGEMDFSKKYYAEWKTDKPFSRKFLKELEKFEPFGTGNKKPLFAVCTGAEEFNPLKIGSPHYSFKTSVCEMLDFKGGDDKEIMELPLTKSIIFEPNVSTFNGVESVKGFVRNIVPDYSDLSGVSLDVIENELKKIPFESTEKIQTADFGDLTHTSYGTIYIATERKTVDKYPALKKLPVFLFDPPKSGETCVVISPKNIPDTYAKAVYLERPVAFSDSKAETFCFSFDGADFIGRLKTDRDTFAKCFSEIRALCGRALKSGAAFFRTSGAGANVDAENFVFSFLVFFELGFFREEKGRLVYDGKEKKQLSSSKIYTRVCEMKGELC